MNYKDIYNEQLVSKQKNKIDLLKSIGLIAIGIIIIIVVYILLPTITLFVLIGVIWGEVFLIRRLNVEFEYAFTNGELDIDRIYNKLSRKHALTIDVRKFIIMIKMNKPNYKSELGVIHEVKNFGTGIVSDTTYAAIYEEDGRRFQLVFDPNEQLINGIKKYIPKKIK